MSGSTPLPLAVRASSGIGPVAFGLAFVSAARRSVIAFFCSSAFWPRFEPPLSAPGAATAIVPRPAILLLDEPLGALDKKLREETQYELMDLQAGGFIAAEVDPLSVSDLILSRYHELWKALTNVERYEIDERWKIDEHIRHLNDLGFDVGELDITTDFGGTHLSIQPKIVDAGHHARRLLRLTGLDVEDNQARRLLNDLDAYRASQDRQNDDEDLVAHEWLARIYEPITRRVPPAMRAKLEPAEVFHEILEHRWLLSERAGCEQDIFEVAADYFRTQLAHRPAEVSTQSLPRTPPR